MNSKTRRKLEKQFQPKQEKRLSKQDKAIALAIFCLIIFAIVGISLAKSFISMDKEGLQCLKTPLKYAENRMFEDKGEEYKCECRLKEDNQFNFNLSNWN